MDDKTKELKELLEEIEAVRQEVEFAQMDKVAEIERLRLSQNKERS